ncbi:hypothetical protein [Campylobacter concisus]|uniref:hypothetical protein n=1 Tax=Campylobacter concisus TaxID=199 RepID=UPI001F36DCF5|nr:hypothetical protein [Campylobacter concisus]
MSELLINKIPIDENMVTIDDDLILDKKHFLSVNLNKKDKSAFFCFSTDLAWNGNRKVLKLSDMLLKIHKQIEDKEIKSISQKDMAQRLGISLSAYTSWLGGAKEPIAMIALLDILAMLDDEGIVRIVREQESNKVIGDKIL